MTQVTLEALVASARSIGEAEATGKVLSRDTLESGRLQAIIPAMQAIEGGLITYEAGMGRALTEAYNEGARKEIKASSMASAASKTSSFLIAATNGLATATLNAVREVIASENDDDNKKTMQKGVFAKLCELIVVANTKDETTKTLSVPSVPRIRQTMLGDTTPLSDNDKLAAQFSKLAKLTDEVSNTEAHVDLAIVSKKYRAQSEVYAARAKAEREEAANVAAQIAKAETDKARDADNAAHAKAEAETANVTLQGNATEAATTEDKPMSMTQCLEEYVKVDTDEHDATLDGIL